MRIFHQVSSTTAPVAEAEEPVLALLGRPRRPRQPQGRALGDTPPALHRNDEDLGGLVLGLDETVGDVVEHADAEGPIAVRGIRELGVPHRAHHPGEHPHPGLAEPIGGRIASEHPRGHDEVRLVVDEGLEHDRDLLRIVLAIGIQGDHVLRPQLHAQRVPDPQRIAVTEVLAQYERDCARLPGDLACLVAPAVDDDERSDREPTRLRRHGRQHRTDVGLLFICANEADDGRQLEVGVPRVELAARLLYDAPCVLGIGVDTGARGRAAEDTQSDAGWRRPVGPVARSARAVSWGSQGRSWSGPNRRQTARPGRTRIRLRTDRARRGPVRGTRSSAFPGNPDERGSCGTCRRSRTGAGSRPRSGGGS